MPPHANPEHDLVVEVKPVILSITWNAINQMVRRAARDADAQVPIAEQHLHPEPKRFWHGADVQKLAVYDSTLHSPPQLGASARFKNEAYERGAFEWDVG
jgi:ubiquitin-conjugating enzyme E2 O